MRVEKATRVKGNTTHQIEFVLTDSPPMGGMKKTYFSPDRSYVVQFYHDPLKARASRNIQRLEFILGKYNPTLPEAQGGAKGTTAETAKYFKKLYCWPTDIVEHPTLGIGIVCPTYPANFFFPPNIGPCSGKDREGTWYVLNKARSTLPASQLGSLELWLVLCLDLARAVRRMHLAGIAHSDLSYRNVLVDPINGKSVLIDIDSLVVPNLFPPDVVGTPGYIAPEVLITQVLPFGDSRRKLPEAKTDLHALAVLIYQYLMVRHPLQGPKTYAAPTAEEQVRLEMGQNALFIEHSSNFTNLPKDLKLKYHILGPYLQELFKKAFEEGLHNPEKRPAAHEWERALVKTIDLLVPCANSGCPQKFFVLYDEKRIRCPYCGTKPNTTIPVLHFRKEKRPGQWFEDGKAVLYHWKVLIKWHTEGGLPNETSDRTPRAYAQYFNGQWFLVNKDTQMLAANGTPVSKSGHTMLRTGDVIQLSQGVDSRKAEIRILTP